MDGVFINLTDKDIELEIESGKIMIVPGNPDLVTPVKNLTMIKNGINGILSTPLKDDDVRHVAGTGWMNTVYTKITRSEEDIKINSYMVSAHVKYPFTDDQIEKINKISNSRMRLLILTEEDVKYWSDGHFLCPFRNYRLFTNSNKKLIEYPIPKTYLDIVMDGVRTINDKINPSAST